MGKLERYARSKNRGGVLDAIPSGAVVSRVLTVDGQRYQELSDGRFVRASAPTTSVSIRGGRVVRGQFQVGVVDTVKGD